MDYLDFGRYFKEERIKSGYKSQRQLASASGISNGTIARIEAGTQKPTIETIKVLSEYLNSTTYGEMLDRLGYFDGLNERKKEEMKVAYVERLEDTLLFRRLINRLAPDGNFTEEIRKDIEEQIGDSVDYDFSYSPEDLERLMYEKGDVSDMWDLFDKFMEIAKRHHIKTDDIVVSNKTKTIAVAEKLKKRLSDLFIKKGLLTRYSQDEYIKSLDEDLDLNSAADVIYVIKNLEMETTIPQLIDSNQNIEEVTSQDLLDLLSNSNLTYRNHLLTEDDRQRVLIMLALLFPDSFFH